MSWRIRETLTGYLIYSSDGQELAFLEAYDGRNFQQAKVVAELMAQAPTLQAENEALKQEVKDLARVNFDYNLHTPVLLDEIKKMTAENERLRFMLQRLVDKNDIVFEGIAQWDNIWDEVKALLKQPATREEGA